MQEAVLWVLCRKGDSEGKALIEELDKNPNTLALTVTWAKAIGHSFNLRTLAYEKLRLLVTWWARKETTTRDPIRLRPILGREIDNWIPNFDLPSWMYTKAQCKGFFARFPIVVWLAFHYLCAPRGLPFFASDQMLVLSKFELVLPPSARGRIGQAQLEVYSNNKQIFNYCFWA